MAHFTGVSPSSIYRLEAGSETKPRGLAQRLLLNAADRIFEAQRNGLLHTIPDPHFFDAKPDVQKSPQTTVKPAPPTRLPSVDTQTNPEQWFRIVAATGTVPHLGQLDISDRWADLAVMSGPDVGGAVDENWLVVAISGDAMEPRFQHGQQVLFRILAKNEAPTVGRDYLIAREDQSATLRRVSTVTTDGIELTALNPAYSSLRVRTDEVAMVGEPRFIVTGIPV